MTEYSKVTGIPAAAIGEDGEIVWLDIPGILSRAKLLTGRWRAALQRPRKPDLGGGSCR
jgi:hypothetical protein